MARPKQFDEDHALQQAIHLFSRHGFAATSTEDLMRTMAIGRQSMYDTFGDKRALFLKALEKYVIESVNAVCDELAKHGRALATVRKALLTFAERSELSNAEGCMGLNAIAEFGLRDVEVTRITSAAARIQRNAVISAFRRAIQQGELNRDADLDSMADFFESILAGIRMSAKSGKNRRALRNIANLAGRALG